MKKKVLITGSEGFIGQHLIKFLSKKSLLIFACHYKKIERIKSRNISYHLCDVRKKNNVKNVIKKIKPDIIYHLAAKSLPSFSFNFPIETIETNLIGTLNILESCRKLRLNPKIIIACSSGQFGSKPLNQLPFKETFNQEPDHLYGLSKKFQSLTGLQYSKMYKLNVIIALIFNTTGPGKENDVFSDFCKQYVKNRYTNNIIRTGNLNKFRDFLHVNDCVKGLYYLQQKGKISNSYNLCSSNYSKVSKIIQLMKKDNPKIKIIKDKKLFRKFDEKYIFGSNNKIKKLGWSPKLGMKDIFKDMCEYYEKIKK